MNYIKKIPVFALVFVIAICTVSAVYAQDTSTRSSSIQSSSPLGFSSFSNATQIPTNTNEVVSVTTDKNRYHYGETIKLTLEDYNSGQNNNMTSFEQSYAGIVGPCGIEYTSFVILPGIWANVTNYDQLVAQQSKSLNVLYGIPYMFYSCPGGYVNQINQVNITENSHDTTIVWTDQNSHIVITKPHLFGIYDIKNIYSKTDRYREFSSGIKFPYRENSTLLVGNYTIIGFDLSGKLSAPLVIQVLNSTNQTQSQITKASTYASPILSKMLDLDVKIFPTSMFFFSSTGSLLSMSLFGIFLMTIISSKKSSKRFSYFAVFLIVALVFSPINSNHANATYTNYDNGIALKPVQNSHPYTAAVQGEFYGISTDLGSNQGLSIQNNQYVVNSNIPNYLWSQSTISAEIPTGNFNSQHTCSTQSISYSCKLPQQLLVYGDAQFWTASAGGSNPCPSGFILQMTLSLCASILTDTEPDTPTISSSIVGIDLYTYQQINSDGTLSLVQKYRLCSSLPCSGSYNQFPQFQSPVYASGPPISYYGDGNNKHSAGDIVAECYTCDTDKFGLNGDATFYEGTYAGLSYQINDLGNGDYDTPSNSSTAEKNRNLLWWDGGISSSGGSTPLFSNTVIHGCSPLPSGTWIIQYNCTLRNTFTAPNYVEISGTTAQPTLLTIPSGLDDNGHNHTLNAHLKQYYIFVDPGMGILIQPGGAINTS